MTAERLFLALPLPEPVRVTIEALIDPELPGVSWTRPEQLHLTLRFLGDVAADAIAPLIERLATVRVAPFLLPIEGTGAFPPKRDPHVLWVGLGRADPRLLQLRQRVDDAILAAGVPVDLRTFHPHVTVGRVSARGAVSATRWLRSHAGFAAPLFQVEAFDLFASELLPTGARHTLKQRFPLAG